MDYRTQIFYGLLHTNILWIIAHRYFMDKYAKYIFDNNAKKKNTQTHRITIL
jgi:hypothetical protein